MLLKYPVLCYYIVQNYWINIKLLNVHKIFEKMWSNGMDLELLNSTKLFNEYGIIEWILSYWINTELLSKY